MNDFTPEEEAQAVQSEPFASMRSNRAYPEVRFVKRIVGVRMLSGAWSAP